MFDFDAIREILSTIGKNKLRTFLTGFAVAWGIFMLIVLLGTGNGLRNGVTSNFSRRAQNSVSLWPGWTSIPYEGLANNREIKFDEKDYNLIKYTIPEVQYISARISKNATLSYKQEYGAWTIDGVSQDAAFINNIKINSGNGRFLNQVDIDKKRKVIVINPEVKRVLFKDEDPIGKYLIADNNIAYQIIGVYSDEGQYRSSLPVFIPFTTAEMLYNQGKGFRQIDFTVVGLNTLEQNQKFIERLRQKMGKLHKFNPDDKSALYIRNTAEDMLETNQIFSGINFFLWIVGAASLMAGIVGVGNIMLITVKERTREIGIRKAIGATPMSILILIILESVLITTSAGYVGMIAGITVNEFGILTDLIFNMPSNNGTPIFKDPSVNMNTAIQATFVMIFAGVISGLIPALKATSISPIEAMRSE